jgi:hypothetical protein
MTPLRDIGLPTVTARSISAPRMYTLELGGYGGARPNLNRKFYY